MTRYLENVTCFVDTNILLYAVELDPTQFEKKRRARDLLKEPDLAISVQVLQEFYAQATRPNRNLPMAHDDALRFLETLGNMRIHPMTVEIFHAAVAISRRYQLSYWDGAILASALSAGCDAVYSEDMSPMQDYGGVRVINPFVNG